jgi:hypothetical protein
LTGMSVLPIGWEPIYPRLPPLAISSCIGSKTRDPVVCHTVFWGNTHLAWSFSHFTPKSTTCGISGVVNDRLNRSHCGREEYTGRFDSGASSLSATEYFKNPQLLWSATALVKVPEVVPRRMLGACEEVKFVRMESVAAGEADEKHKDECGVSAGSLRLRGRSLVGDAVKGIEASASGMRFQSISNTRERSRNVGAQVLPVVRNAGKDANLGGQKSGKRRAVQCPGCARMAARLLPQKQSSVQECLRPSPQTAESGPAGRLLRQ